MKTILVIEDDSDIVELLDYILTEAGHNVVTSLTLKSVDYIKELSPDLILLDHRLSDGLGKELCILIKADSVTNSIPVIFLSADMDIEQLAASSWADDYIAKPFDIETLIEKIDGPLNK